MHKFRSLINELVKGSVAGGEKVSAATGFGDERRNINHEV